MKYIALFILSLAIGIGLVYFIHNRPVKTPPKKIASTPTHVPTPTLFTVKDAPKLSKTGVLLSFDGTVLWESREETELSPISTSVILRQGDIIETADDGSAVIFFKDALTLNIQKDTRIIMAQTLSANFVFIQNSGEVEYESTGSIPVSIRSLHLLIDQNEATVNVVVDEDEIITVEVTEGSANVVYNDSDFISQLLTIEEGEILTFDNALREAEIE